MATIRSNWTESELIVVLSLYLVTPFGRMHAKNPHVVAISKKINRTPSAVALKLVNFASLDPEHMSRGVRGMQNSSALDRKVWQTYYGKWELLANSIDDFDDKIEAIDDGEIKRRTTLPTEASGIRTYRTQQTFFRRCVVSAYDSKCCITGISTTQLLRASHIIPWAISPTDRLNPSNGICLNTLHDAAFDQGLITFDPTLHLKCSRTLHKQMPETIYEQFFARFTDRQIALPERFAPNLDFVRYHREKIFKDAN